MEPPLTPALDFMMHVRGTLPEAISEHELPKLNYALEFLFAELRQASRRFQEQGDGGREGAAVALGAIWQFVVLFKTPLDENLHVPILYLQDALLGLVKNNVAPLLEPVARVGRPPSSDVRLALKGVAAATVKRLQDAGLDRKKACQNIARELKKLGVKQERGSAPMTAHTIRHWCATVAEDVARTGPAAVNYDLMFTADENARFASLPQDRAREFALKSLTEFVRAIFPESTVSQKTT